MEDINRTVVVAVGGNALITDKTHISLQDQYAAASEAMKHVAQMVADGWSVIVTHGNGPQVGFLLRRVELASAELPPIPLDGLGADTQGATGYMFGNALGHEFAKIGVDKQIVALVTRTVVDAKDPAFQKPTKPIGSFMDEDEAKRREAELGWDVVEDAGRGWRRVVASPKPVRIAEVEAIRTLVENGFTVIAAGGGGIPVVEDGEGFTGIEAVIDKDFGASMLANQLDAGTLLISTAVDAVAINFNTPDEKWLGNVCVDEVKEYLAAGQFGAGSMAPKIEAAIAFLERGGRRVIITSPPLMAAALKGEAGTTITA
ncbi:carbamate kinase [Raineyella fluvialis]|uniref:Carbamate kinase n=1 Tax=Raineyella fluvialis TaxID=2662261 RepID=A0A5Q2FAH2_9ACTN|nr:carbamate kinase [Raineyella fluvialis]QGF23371.1 carbamate kinase [Raineyella fluvialis]